METFTQMRESNDNRIMTVKEVSEYLRCHTSTIYRFVAREEIPHFRIGSDIRFLLSSVNEWIVRHSRPMRAAGSRGRRERA
jgi:excisionase family DNA binding protein